MFKVSQREQSRDLFFYVGTNNIHFYLVIPFQFYCPGRGLILSDWSDWSEGATEILWGLGVSVIKNKHSI